MCTMCMYSPLVDIHTKVARRLLKACVASALHKTRVEVKVVAPNERLLRVLHC
jgi:hypothetical protein